MSDVREQNSPHVQNLNFLVPVGPGSFSAAGTLGHFGGSVWVRVRTASSKGAVSSVLA